MSAVLSETTNQQRAKSIIRGALALLPLYARNLLPPSLVNRPIRRSVWINSSVNFLLRFCSTITCVGADIEGAL